MTITPSFDEAAWLQGAAETTNLPNKEKLLQGWNKPQLERLGLCFPLSPCRITFSKIRLECILSILTDMFRKLSLDTSFQDAPIAAFCTSLDQVQFEVSFFEVPSDSPDHGKQVILEIQRYSGDTILFHRYARQILAAARAGQCDSLPRTPASFHKRRTASLTTDRSANPNQAPANEDELKDIITEAVEQAFHLVTQDRYDAQQLGLESLLCLTDPKTSGMTTAKATATMILEPSNLSQERGSKILLAMVCSGANEASPDLRSSAYLALAVLSQVFSVAVHDGTLDVQRFANRCLVDCLVHRVHDARSHPHDAYFAAQSLASLCALAPDMRARVRDSDVRAAKHYGELHHLALANASQKLLTVLH